MNFNSLARAMLCLLSLILLYPQLSFAMADKAPPPGCNVPRGYDCATPGFETPLTLAEAIELSKTETVVYLYGKGLKSARIVARVVRRGDNAPSIPVVAVPGSSVPGDVMYVVMLGNVIKHRESGEPVEFYQRYLDRGKIFNLTRTMYSRSKDTP